MFTGGHDRDDNADECYTATTLTSVQRARQWHYISTSKVRHARLVQQSIAYSQIGEFGNTDPAGTFPAGHIRDPAEGFQRCRQLQLMATTRSRGGVTTRQDSCQTR